MNRKELRDQFKKECPRDDLFTTFHVKWLENLLMEQQEGFTGTFVGSCSTALPGMKRLPEEMKSFTIRNIPEGSEMRFAIQFPKKFDGPWRVDGITIIRDTEYILSPQLIHNYKQEK